MIAALMLRSRTTAKFAASRCWLAAAAVICVSALGVGAQEGNVLERQLKTAPGRDLRAAVYADIRPDCTSGALPAIRLVTAPAHGAVSVKRGTLKATNFKQCLATEVPALVVFYRPAAEFAGADAFELEITLGGRKKLERLICFGNWPGVGARLIRR
jgi:hypothetical protein